ncbi:t-SNARE, partial [Martensiomyces pterosporus]
LSSIDEDIAKVDGNVDELSMLHNKLLSTADGSKSESIARQRDKKTAETNDLVAKLRRELDAVEQMNENTQMNPSDEATQRGKHAALVRRLMGVLDKYRTLERESQKRYQTRIEKHIRLVKPDATDEEVAAAVSDEASRSMFAMDVMSSYRSKTAKRMLRDVEQRDKDIRNISNTIELLNRMFTDMQEIVSQQQDMLDNIEQAVDSTHEYTAKANQEVKEATRIRIASRKKKWIIIVIVFLIIAAIALGVAIPVAT